MSTKTKSKKVSKKVLTTTPQGAQWLAYADEFVALKRQIIPLQARLGQLCHIIKDDCPFDKLERVGDYQVIIHDDSRTTVANETVRTILGEQWFKKHATVALFKTIRFSDLRGASDES